MDEILKGCINRNRRQQKALYDLYYKYGLVVALAYCSHEDEAREVLNDAFLKVFDNIKNYDASKPFEAWF
ncbi:MAG: sigma factor, partial [Caldilineaceae bacterium]